MNAVILINGIEYLAFNVTTHGDIYKATSFGIIEDEEVYFSNGMPGGWRIDKIEEFIEFYDYS